MVFSALGQGMLVSSMLKQPTGSVRMLIQGGGAMCRAKDADDGYESDEAAEEVCFSTWITRASSVPCSVHLLLSCWLFEVDRVHPVLSPQLFVEQT